MRAFARFLRSLWQMPLASKIWAVILTVTNLVAPLFFIQQQDAQVVLGVFVANLIALTALTSLLGYTRLVSLGHVIWLPMVYFFYLQLGEIPANTAFGIWIRALIVINSAALIHDAYDIWRYVRGDRTSLIEDPPS